MSNQIDNAYKSAPSHDQLRAMDRDLRFQPCEVADPTTLTSEQLEAFNRAGYLTGIPIFSAAEMAGHRAFFDEQLAKVMAAGLGSHSISSALPITNFSEPVCGIPNL